MNEDATDEETGTPSEEHDAELLWRLAGGDPGNDPPPPDEVLVAYREGRLSPAEEEALETLLIASRPARERLVALAGVTLPTPRPSVRTHVLARRPDRRPRVLWWTAAAAAALLLVFGLTVLRPPRLPSDATFTATLTGLAQSRSAPGAGETPETTRKTEALPDTRVRILVEPEGPARAGVEFGLYRPAGSRLERLTPSHELRLDVGRGVARFEATARHLVGEVPGAHWLYVVVAEAGDLPRGATLAAGEDPVAHLAGRERRRVLPIQILLRSAPLADPVLEEMRP